MQQSEFALATAAETEVVVCTNNDVENFNPLPPQLAAVRQKVSPLTTRPPATTAKPPSARPPVARPQAAVSGELFPCRICGKLVKLL